MPIGRLVRLGKSRRIVDWTAVHDSGSLGAVEIDQQVMAVRLVEYSASARALGEGGVLVEGIHRNRGGVEARRVRDPAAAWLQKESA